MKSTQKTHLSNPHDLHNLLTAIITSSKKNFIAMGQVLSELRNNNNYKRAVGSIDTWRAYLAQPEIGLSLGEANRLIQIYEEFIIRLGFAPEMVSEVPIKNLHYLLPMVKGEKDKDKVGEWLADATLLSQSDFRERIGEEKKEQCTYEFMVMKRCQENGRLTKVLEISHEQIIQAFNL